VKITSFVWTQDRIQHISRHNVVPEEFEEVCFGHPWVERAKTEGANPVYHVSGQTHAGRYLLCVVIQFPDGRGYPVTARNLTRREQRRLQQRRRPWLQ
jgi:uncharacterized DUF497 family protein